MVNYTKRESAYQPEKELKNWGLTVRDFTLLSSLKPEDQAQKEYKYTALPQRRPILQCQVKTVE